MYKRGQVTIFIILGIVIVAVLAFVFFLGGISFGEELSNEEAQRFVSSRTEVVSTFVEGCVEQSAWVVLNTLGRQGGYVVPRADNLDIIIITDEDSGVLNYAAYLEDNEYSNVFPSLSSSEDEFERVLQDITLDPDNQQLGFGECIDDFKAFKNNFDKISYGDLNVEVDFENSVLIKVSFPVTLTKSGYETTIEEYYVVLPVNMKEIYSVSNLFINNAIENSGDMTKLINVREDLVNRYVENDELISVDFDHYYAIEAEGYNNPENLLFKLSYENPDLENEYMFRFLVGIGE